MRTKERKNDSASCLISKHHPCLISFFQWFVRRVSGTYHPGLWAFRCPEFCGRKVLLLFLTTSCLLHRRTRRQLDFLSVLNNLMLHMLVSPFHFLCNECCLIAQLLKGFPIHAGFSYSYHFVTHFRAILKKHGYHSLLQGLGKQDVNNSLSLSHSKSLWPGRCNFFDILHDQQMSKVCWWGTVLKNCFPNTCFLLNKTHAFYFYLKLSHTV